MVASKIIELEASALSKLDFGINRRALDVTINFKCVERHDADFFEVFSHVIILGKSVKRSALFRPGSFYWFQKGGGC